MIEKQVSSDCYERIVIPEKLIQKKIKGKWQKIQSVLIPGYIFVVAEDRVFITEGPLKGMEGMIKKIDRHRRTAATEIEMFDRKVPINVRPEIVEKR